MCRNERVDFIYHSSSSPRPPLVNHAITVTLQLSGSAEMPVFEIAVCITLCLPPDLSGTLQFRRDARVLGVPLVSIWRPTASELRRTLLPVFDLYTGRVAPDEVASFAVDPKRKGMKRRSAGRRPPVKL